MKKFHLTLLSLSLLAQSFQVGADNFATLNDIPADNMSHQEMAQVAGQGFDPNWLMGMFFLMGKMQGQTNSEAAKGALKVGVAATVLNNAATTQSNPIILPTAQTPKANATPMIQVQPVQYPYANIQSYPTSAQYNFLGSATGSCGSSYGCMVQQQAETQLRNKGYTGSTDPLLAQEIALTNQAAFSGLGSNAVQAQALIHNTIIGALNGRGIRNPSAMMGVIAAQDLSSQLSAKLFQKEP